MPLAWIGFRWRERNAVRRLHKLGTVTSWNYSHAHGGLVAVTLIPTGGNLSGKDLDRLAGIKRLTLRGPIVTDGWLCNLKRASDVKFLDLSETSISDSGLACLAAMPDLVSLDLRNTAITDAGLKHLTCLTDLEALQLSGTRITDDGLNDLLLLKNLGANLRAPLPEFRGKMPWTVPRPQVRSPMMVARS